MLCRSSRSYKNNTVPYRDDQRISTNEREVDFEKAKCERGGVLGERKRKRNSKYRLRLTRTCAQGRLVIGDVNDNWADVSGQSRPCYAFEM